MIPELVYIILLLTITVGFICLINKNLEEDE
jgi:hypothetical protein